MTTPTHKETQRLKRGARSAKTSLRAFARAAAGDDRHPLNREARGWLQRKGIVR